MKNEKKIKLKNRKYIIIFVVFVVLLLFLNIARIFPFNKKQIPRPTSGRLTNSVKYAEATQNEQLSPAQKTQDTAGTPSANNVTSSKTITLNAAGQDEVGGPVIIAAIISGINSGNCNISMSNRGSVRIYSAPINWLGGFYSCKYAIPFGDIYPGLWLLNIVATQGNQSSSTTQQVLVK